MFYKYGYGIQVWIISDFWFKHFILTNNNKYNYWTFTQLHATASNTTVHLTSQHLNCNRNTFRTFSVTFVFWLFNIWTSVHFRRIWPLYTWSSHLSASLTSSWPSRKITIANTLHGICWHIPVHLRTLDQFPATRDAQWGGYLAGAMGLIAIYQSFLCIIQSAWLFLKIQSTLNKHSFTKCLRHMYLLEVHLIDYFIIMIKLHFAVECSKE